MHLGLTIVHRSVNKSIFTLSYLHMACSTMYVVAIAWLYVALLVSIAQPSVLRAVLTFVGTGLFPLAIILYLAGSPQRRRNRAQAERAEAKTKPAKAATPESEPVEGSGQSSVDPDH
ncbi:MAG: hypothetical protein VW339_09885 [Quisquiliibacterium sp.]